MGTIKTKFESLRNWLLIILGAIVIIGTINGSFDMINSDSDLYVATGVLLFGVSMFFGYFLFEHIIGKISNLFIKKGE